MKWTKFDPSNPPKSNVLFMFEYVHGENECATHYHTGIWVKDYGSLFYDSDGLKNYSADEMQKYNAHWIYPQLLEMPE
jgi:hypothetical protein